MGIKERTGVRMPKHLLFKMAFDAGYEAGADAATCGELLAKARALQSAFYDLDGKTRRAIALDELMTAVDVKTIEHEEGCGCRLCRALESV